MSDYEPRQDAGYEPAAEAHPEYQEPPALPLEQEDRVWALAAHLSGPASTLLSAGTLSFLAPLIIWLVKRDENAFVAEEAKEALNFQITIFVAMMGGLVVSFLTCGLGFIFYVPFAIVVAIASFVLGIIAAIQAYDGKPYRYPYTWRPVA